ncbi:EXPERA domain-containing protein [Gryllotalpicola protaetiae]|uniref:EXPERA domain-containing protein n=1 Tax=Gryllotalpicola protaetiae TaxID=2419771 RepID=UPI001FE3FF18|nr:emopamil-binding family protein [Gryllotalpicola protaetiae]
MTSPAAGSATRTTNLPITQRPIDFLFLVVFAVFIVTSIISDSVEGLGLDQVADSPNILVRWNFWYASNFDPLYQAHPLWLRFISGTSAFVYIVFYVVLLFALVRGWNWIQLPSVIYATMIIALTGIPIFGVELFGPAGQATPNVGVFLAFNLPYIVFPLLLLIRMRKPLPFTRRW